MCGAAVNGKRLVCCTAICGFSSCDYRIIFEIILQRMYKLFASFGDVNLSLEEGARDYSESFRWKC